MRKKGFLKYIHNYRAFAILSIVAGHVYYSLNWPDEPIYTLIEWVFFDHASIIFVFISGFLFQYLGFKYAFNKYFRTKLRYVISPYLLLSIPIILIRLLFFKPTGFLSEMYPGFAEFNPIYRIGFYIVTGTQLRSYWFIPMIFIFYIASPLLIRLDRNPKFYIPVLIILLIISLSIPRSGNSLLPFHSFLYFLSPFVLGMYVSRNKEKIFFLFINYWPLTTFIMLFLLALTFEYPNEHIIFLQKFYASIFSISLLWKLESVFHLKLGKIADYSFGIFFLHDYVDLVFKFIAQKLTGDFNIQGSALMFLFLLSATLLICMGIIKVIKIIFKDKSRMIVGS